MLAHDCEMSVRSVYDQITILERLGLLKVVSQTFQAASGKYSSNAYILGCDPDFAQHEAKPSANPAVGRTSQSPSANSRSNRRQNLPTNSVNKPVNEPSPQPPKRGARVFGVSEGVKKYLEMNK
jgi:hypothetical protein